MNQRPNGRVRPSVFDVAHPLAAGLFRARGWTSLRTEPAVLVYQMAKVGSQTVVRSIRAARPGLPAFHVHTLTDDGIAAMQAFYRSSGWASLLWAGHLLVSRCLQQQLRQGVMPGRWKVVTLVRDPVARNISLLFQLGRRLLPDFDERCDAGRLDPVAILEQFAADFPRQVACMRWFRDELHPVFGVDPFATPFDREAGYHRYRGSFADVLLLRTEDLDRTGAAALRSFLGLQQLRWKRANVGTEKANGLRYARLLDRLQLPQAFVDRYYDTPEVRHFYSLDELDRLRSRWCGPRGAVR